MLLQQLVMQLHGVAHSSALQIIHEQVLRVACLRRSLQEFYEIFVLHGIEWQFKEHVELVVRVTVVVEVVQQRLQQHGIVGPFACRATDGTLRGGA